MAITVYPQVGFTYPDALGVPITADGAIVDESQYINDAITAGYLLTSDPLGVFQPTDRTDTTSGGAPVAATYVVVSAVPGLSNEHVLSGEGGTTVTPSPGAVVVSSPEFSAATPSPVGVASAGDSGEMSHSNHTHAHGAQLGGSLHAVATSGAAGFMSAADKTQLGANVAAVAGLAAAPFIAYATSGTLTNGLVLTAGANTTITPGVGTLTIASSGASTGILCPELNSLTGTTDREIRVATGYYADGDAGGGTFYWDASSTATVNNGTVFGPVGTGRWMRLYAGALHLKWFGAKGDDAVTDDTDAIETWLAAIPAFGEGFMNAGYYRITRPLLCATYEVKIVGEGEAKNSGTSPCFLWDGTDPNVFVLTMSSVHPVIQNVHFKAAQDALGFLEFGSIGGSLSSQGEALGCSFLCAPGPADPEVQYGIAIGYTSPAENNQEYCYFERCGIANMAVAGFYFGGNPNALGHKLRRCGVANYFGSPGGKVYISTGQTDGLPHGYGAGIKLVNGNQFSLEDCAFSALEMWIDGQAGTGRNYISVRNSDSEYCKKAFYGYFADYSILKFECARVDGPTGFGNTSLGPVGFAATDYRFFDIYGVRGLLYLDSMVLPGPSYDYVDNVGPSVKCPSVVAINCMFPGTKPFDGANQTRVVSWGNFGSNGAGDREPVLNGAYRFGNATLEPEPTAFDFVQSLAPDYNWQPTSMGDLYGPNRATSRHNTMGVFTISDAATTAPVVFLRDEANTSYTVRITPTAITGAPAAGSTTALAASKTVSGFTATALAAPGVGSSVSYVWEIVTGYLV